MATEDKSGSQIFLSPPQKKKSETNKQKTYGTFLLTVEIYIWKN